MGMMYGGGCGIQCGIRTTMALNVSFGNHYVSKDERGQKGHNKAVYR